MSEPVALPPQLDTIPFAVLIDEAWRSTRAWARTILVPAALLLAPAALVVQVLAGLWNMSIVTMDPSHFEFGSFCGTFAIGLVGLLVVGLYFAAVYGCVMVSAIGALDGKRPSLGSALRFYARPRVWGTDLLAWILTMLGMLACLLPGLFLMTAWSLRLPVMVREERYGWDSLKRSWELLAHNPSGQWIRHPLLKVFLLFVLGAVLGYAVSMLVQFPAIAANQVIMMRAMTRGETIDARALIRATLWLSIPAGVIAALAQLAVQLYVDFAKAHLYVDQVRRKEGRDLGAALDQLVGGGRVAGDRGPAMPPAIS